MEVKTKRRHGCVTVWLVLMIILNSISAIIYLFFRDIISKILPFAISNLELILFALFEISNVFYSILLLKWKKNGFWGFVVTAVSIMIINLNFGMEINSQLFGLISIAILYGVLHLKKDGASTWSKLE